MRLGRQVLGFLAAYVFVSVGLLTGCGFKMAGSTPTSGSAE